MRIYLWSIGKPHDSYVKEGIETFTRRASHYFPTEWKVFPNVKNAGSFNEEQLKKAESASIIKNLQSDDVLVVLDENGRQFSSPELAGFLAGKANASVKNLVFLVGGAYGIHDDVFKRADFKWSLSKLVFPHQLVRLILSEQIYRACTIIRNEKYHHS